MGRMRWIPLNVGISALCSARLWLKGKEQCADGGRLVASGRETKQGKSRWRNGGTSPTHCRAWPRSQRRHVYKRRSRAVRPAETKSSLLLVFSPPAKPR
ncbi:hypothetical protein BD414DRAFT_494942 [Trametes punicea]|nr:hypothetical protein BD414DRAFT_494942 [Trametes punicea]